MHLLLFDLVLVDMGPSTQQQADRLWPRLTVISVACDA